MKKIVQLVVETNLSSKCGSNIIIFQKDYENLTQLIQ